MQLLWKALVHKCMYSIRNISITVLFSDACDAGLVSPRYCAARANSIIFYHKNPLFKTPKKSIILDQDTHSVHSQTDIFYPREKNDDFVVHLKFAENGRK